MKKNTEDSEISMLKWPMVKIYKVPSVLSLWKKQFLMSREYVFEFCEQLRSFSFKRIMSKLRSFQIKQYWSKMFKTMLISFPFHLGVVCHVVVLEFHHYLNLLGALNRSWRRPSNLVNLEFESVATATRSLVLLTTRFFIKSLPIRICYCFISLYACTGFLIYQLQLLQEEG